MSGGRQGNFLIFNYYKNGHEWVCDGFDRYKYSYTEVIQVDFDTWIYNDVVTYPTYFHMNWGGVANMTDGSG
ncbi:C10 family peptidase [Parapedobacter indicus]|uniref:C10 family peptidase n=1 Tax=Parapedobacter indicus TaxID=1477437 RepID=UPI000B8477C2